MNKTQLKRIKNDLLSKEREILVSLSDRSVLQIEPTADDVDNTIDAAIRDLAVIYKNKQKAIILQLRTAIYKIDEGTYGECSDCEEPINSKRLDALPWATRCISCQEAFDAAIASGEIVPETEQFTASNL